jgi:acid phosphatase (class A)
MGLGRGAMARSGLLALSVLALSGAAGAWAPSGGYLSGHEPDTLVVVPQAPAPGSVRDQADRDIFKATRALEGSPRWALARNDAKIDIPSVLKDFSCATGVSLTPENAPALVKVLNAMVPDVAPAYSRPKDLYKRPRPYLRDKGDICLPDTPDLHQSYDYPSGHATFAWTWGLILADLMPDRAGAILTRARSIGESRVVCGVHSASAITEGRTAGSAVFAALQADPGFQADMARARDELTALRASPAAPAPGPDACAAETALIAKTPW